MIDHVAALDQFSPATAEWFARAFDAPTSAQSEAWAAIRSGDHTLVIAPTGSGKTLAAFLWGIDTLTRAGVSEAPLVAHRAATDRRACRILYVSPLKALAADVEKNLRHPLDGIRDVAARRGEAVPDVRVALRSGDTPSDERRRFARFGADILITTPESLFLLLTSAAREALTGVETVIVDEVHSLASTKRGAHLAVSLDRLDLLLRRPAQRVGLSATVRPVEAVATFLAGGRPVTVVAPPSAKDWSLTVEVPVPDLGDLANTPDPAGQDASSPAGTRRRSIWPHVTGRLVDLIERHTSTIVFVNSRQVAERLATRINDVWEERGNERSGYEGRGSEERANEGRGEYVPPDVRRLDLPAGYIGAASVAAGSAAVAMAHHGSMSHERRKEIEDALKAGELRAVVATSSLELGIDMGAVDLVIQVEAPGSVASGLQRIGRAGHQVGATSEGRFFPKYLGDLVAMTVVVDRMRAGALEATRVARNPLDVLAQQVVAMAALDEWDVGELWAVLRRSAPFATLSRHALDTVLDMLAGRYPSQEFAELRPRLDWDRAGDRIRGRKGAQRLAVTSGGTIPDRGLYAVFAEGEGAGRRVGELDEEMVFESRVGDTITLGSSSWLITAITADQVHVVAAPGAPARLPFWKGDGLGRTAELGEAIGVFVRELADGPDPRDRLAALGLDEWARDNLMAYVEDQRAATGVVPDDKTIVVESFRDELGDWRVVVLSPWGHRVHLPWSLLIAARFAEAHGVGIQAMPTDDGIGFRLPDTAQEGDVDAPAWAREGLGAHLVVDPDHVEGLVRAELAHSTHFAARFREAAARALLLPRRQPGRRQPLWQLRNRSAQLLQVAARYPEFPIMAEAARECLHDDFDLGALAELMARIGRREVRVVEVTTPRPSPFARTVLFNYVGLFMYEADTPLAELRAAALTVDPALLSDLLGGGAGLALADLLDAEVVALVERELQCLTESRWARDPEDVHDLVRRLGPITTRDLQERTRPEVRSRVGEWLDALARDHQIESFSGLELSSARAGGSETEDKWGVAGDVDVDSFPGGELPSARAGRSGTEDRWSVAGDVDADSFPGGEIRSARAGWSGAEKRWIVAGEGGVAASTLILRYARTHGPFALAEVEAWLLGGSSVGGSSLDTAGWSVPLAAALVADGRLVEGKLRPGAPGVTVHCDPGVLARLRRRSLTKLRAEVRPVEQAAYARFLPRWQGVGDRSRRGLDGLSRTVEQLAGVAVPASALETFVLPARVADYRVGLLDELLSTGEVVWAGRGELAGGDGWVTLSPADLVDAFPAEPALELGELDDRVWRAVAGGGAYRLAEVVAAMAAQATVPVARDEVDARGAVPQARDEVDARGAVPPGRDALDARVAVPQGRDALDARGAASVVRDAGDSRGTAPAAADVLAALWRLAWAGLVTTDTFAPLRERLAGVRPTTRARPPTPRSRLGRPRLGLARPARLGQADLGGRWFALPTPPTGERAEAQRAVARAEVLLDRHGVVTRGAVRSEGVPGGFAGVYRVLALAEDQGRVRRGYFVDRLGGSQFAAAGVVDRLRAEATTQVGSVEEGHASRLAEGTPWGGSPGTGGATVRPAEGMGRGELTRPDRATGRPAEGTPWGASTRPDRATVLAAADPANPYGAALPWPGHDGAHQPSRKAGALVVLVDGELAAFVERGGHTILTFADHGDAVAHALARTVREGRVDSLTVTAVDGLTVFAGPPLRGALERAGFLLGPQGLRLRR